jgi:hypothetical protein
MSKLFQLKKWVTVHDAAKRLAITFGEEVTKADVLQLGLDGQLNLSVNFVNHAHARCGRVVPLKDAQYQEFPTDFKAALKAKSLEEYQGGYTKIPMGIMLNSGELIELEDDVVTLEGLFDLPLIGGDRLDIEHEFQRLTDGPAVTLTNIDGAFVTDQVGKIYQLQENYDDNEYQVGSLAHLEKIELHIIAKKLDSIKAEVLLNEHKELRKQFLERRKSEPRKSRFYPAGGLPDDAVLVVRTNALIEFEQSLIGKSEATEKSPSTREHTSYLNIIGALMELIKSPKAGRSDASRYTQVLR